MSRIHFFRMRKSKQKTYDGVHDQRRLILSANEWEILRILNRNNVNLNEIITHFGYSARNRSIRNTIKRLLDLKLIQYAIPDKPRSKKQQYQITKGGELAISTH